MSGAPESEAAAALQQLGAQIKLGKRGSVLQVDFRPIADQVTDQALGECPRVREVQLDGSRITDQGLMHLTGLAKLLTLSLQQTAITDAGLQTLMHSSSLKLLVLTGADVTRAGLERARKRMLKTRIVCLEPRGC